MMELVTDFVLKFEHRMLGKTLTRRKLWLSCPWNFNRGEEPAVWGWFLPGECTSTRNTGWTTNHENRFNDGSGLGDSDGHAELQS